MDGAYLDAFPKVKLPDCSKATLINQMPLQALVPYLNNIEVQILVRSAVFKPLQNVGEVTVTTLVVLNSK